ncbi:MAG: elongation factor P [Gammaproteobacteria bacterium]|nr:elongation factor P [Gammaproteobacteria bacterium]
MKISAFEIRVGNLIEYQDKLWRVLKTSHVKPGKGGAFVQAEMKAVPSGTKLNERFRSDEKLEKAHVESRTMQYLYKEGNGFVFMDTENFEQLTIDAEDLEAEAGFLVPNSEVQINIHNGVPFSVELPSTVVLEVVETESVVKGQTASGSGKPAQLETGLSVTVPPFVNTGDRIRVNTQTGEYVDRAN